MSHTPGPWTFAGCRKDSNFSRAFVGIVTTQVGNVARTYPKATDSRDEVEANGHLIAAAPDLLEALKLARVEMGIDNPEWFDDGEVAGKIRAAIAKAEGK